MVPNQVPGDHVACDHFILVNFYFFKSLSLDSDCYLKMVEGFEHPYDPRTYVVVGFMLLKGSPTATRSKMQGQTESSSEAPYDETIKSVTSLVLLWTHRLQEEP